MINNDLVKDAPKSWDDLLKGKYKVTVGDVGIAAQANNAVLAAAFARGGDENNLNLPLNFLLNSPNKNAYPLMTQLSQISKKVKSKLASYGL